MGGFGLGRTEHVVDDAREAGGQRQRDHAVGVEARVRVAAVAAAHQRAHLPVEQVHDDRLVPALVALPRLSYARTRIDTSTHSEVHNAH